MLKEKDTNEQTEGLNKSKDFLKRKSQKIRSIEKENEKTSNFENPKKMCLRNSWEPKLLQNKEINSKYFPAKDLICKGQSSNNIKEYYNSNSPMVQYYTGGIEKLNSPNLDNNNFIEQNFNVIKRGSGYSNSSFQNFNYSPSNIFNQNNNNLNNSSINGNTPISNSNGTQYLLNGALRKSLTEKMENNNLDNFVIYSLEENDENQEIENEEDSLNKDDKDLLMLSFNSDDDNLLLEENDDNERNLRHLRNENNNNNLRKSIHMPIASAMKKAMEKENKKNNDENKGNCNLNDNFINNSTQNKIKETNNNINYINYNINNNLNFTTYYQNNLIQKNYYINNYNNYQLDNPINSFSTNNYEVTNQYLFSEEENQNKYFNCEKELFSKNVYGNKKSKKIKRLEPSSYINIPLADLSNKFLILGRDQGACRYLQKLLEEKPNEVLDYLYQPLLNNILNLINDPFGNYLIQKMFKPMSENQIKEIMIILSPHFLTIGCNCHGTRVLQALIEKLSNKYLREYFLKGITPLIIPLLQDLNGTHIVQKFAELYNEYDNFINEIIIQNSSVLSTHRHGCCVIQKYLEILNNEMKNKLIDSLISNCLFLMTDQFGNYVIQSILQIKNIDYGNRIVKKMINNICFYSKHKYSSNVVEKCFENCNGEIRNNLINTLLKKENLKDLILDEHGNYIVQKIISISDYHTQKYILDFIKEIDLKNVHFGEKLLNKLYIQYPNIMFMREIKN